MSDQWKLRENYRYPNTSLIENSRLHLIANTINKVYAHTDSFPIRVGKVEVLGQEYHIYLEHIQLVAADMDIMKTICERFSKIRVVVRYWYAQDNDLVLVLAEKSTF